MAIIDIPLLTFAIWWFVQVILHELGHYIAYRAFGIKPKLAIKWWGITIGEKGDFFRLTPRKWYTVAVAGPLFSVIFWSLTFPNEAGLLVLIIFASVIDLAHMFTVVSNWKELGRNSPTYGHMIRRASLNEYHELTDLMEEVYEGRTLDRG